MLKKILLIIGFLVITLQCNSKNGYSSRIQSKIFNNQQYQKNGLFLTSQNIGKELLQLSVYHTFLTNKNQFKSLNLELNSNLLTKISSINLLQNIVNDKKSNKRIFLFDKNKPSNYYEIKENIQNKIPRAILKIISNYMGSLLNITPNDQNTLLDLTKYESEEYNLIQQLGAMHSCSFIENEIKKINGNHIINLNLLKSLIKEGNSYCIPLTLSHPNIKRIKIKNNEYTNNFHNPKQLNKILLKHQGPQFNKNGLHAYYYCDNCNNNYWKYLGKHKFNIARLASDEEICKICNNQPINLKILGIHNCTYNIEMSKFLDPNKLPFQENLEDFNENGQVTLDNKFIVLNTLGRLSYFEIFIN